MRHRALHPKRAAIQVMLSQCRRDTAEEIAGEIRVQVIPHGSAGRQLPGCPGCAGCAGCAASEQAEADANIALRVGKWKPEARLRRRHLVSVRSLIAAEATGAEAGQS